MVFNLFNSQGALEDGQEFRDARQGALIEAQDYVGRNPYFAAQSPEEQVHFDRTMLPVMQDGVQQVNEAGQPLYETPERGVYLKNAQYIQGLEDKANQDFERKVSNPLFKVGDFAADLFRNTVAAPINLLTGENGFHVDPSASAVEGYKARLTELDNLRTANHQLFIGGRDKRAKAFAESLPKASGTTKADDQNRLIQPMQDGSSAFVRNEFGEIVKVPDRSDIFNIGGVPHRRDPLTGDYVPAVDQQEVLKLQREETENKIYAEGRAKYMDARPQAVMALNTERNRVNVMRTQIEGARRLIQDLGASGWNGLMSVLPESEARELNRYLETIKANVGFQALQEMRATNKNGGALGNVSELELKQLNAVLGTLDQMTTADQLLESLGLVEEKANAVIYNLKGVITERDSYYKLSDEQRVIRDAYSASDNTADATTAPSQNAQVVPEGYELMVDANGNEAYVHPNGDIIEVQ